MEMDGEDSEQLDGMGWDLGRGMIVLIPGR